MQDIVVGNKQLTEVARPSEIVSLLLNDDELANLGTSDLSMKQLADRNKMPKDKPGDVEERREATVAGALEPDLWNDEGDDFFGTTSTQNPGNTSLDDDLLPPVFNAGSEKKKFVERQPTKRGRKSLAGKGGPLDAAPDTFLDEK